jgi:hypothetical protein
MKNTGLFKCSLTISFFTLLIILISCQDQFTEKDALLAQQQIDLTIYVADASTTNNAPVNGAKVSVSQSGTALDAVTDAQGIAKFPKMKVGEYVYTITADSYTSMTGTGAMDPANFRQGEVSAQYGIYSLTSDRMATVKGHVSIDTDVTNDLPEAAANISVFADVWLNNGSQTFIGTTDANGDYIIKVPADGTTPGSTCTQVNIRFPDLELNQTIAYNKQAGDLNNFPSALPVKVNNMLTLFSMDNSFIMNEWFPNVNTPQKVRTVYAIADPAPSNGKTAVIDRVFVDNQGKIIDVNFNTGGNYPARGIINVAFTSLSGGTGATLQIDLTAAGTENAQTAFNNGFFTLTEGSGYPEEFGLNRISPRTSSKRANLCISPSSINIANADYGTGNYRAIGLQ